MKFFLCILRLYQLSASVFFSFIGVRCRFYPSCSHYAQICFRNFGIFLAIKLVFLRILKCNPLWNGSCIDFPPRVVLITDGQNDYER